MNWLDSSWVCIQQVMLGIQWISNHCERSFLSNSALCFAETWSYGSNGVTPLRSVTWLMGPEVVKMRLTGTNGKVPGTVTPDFGVDPSNCNAKKN